MNAEPRDFLEPIKIAIFGTGVMGSLHLKTQLDSKQLSIIEQGLDFKTKLVGIFDADQTKYNGLSERLRDLNPDRFDKMVMADSLDQLLSLNPHIAIIATPVDVDGKPVQYDTTRACLERGIITMCENPLTGDVMKAKELYKLAQQNGTSLRTNWTFANNPIMEVVLREIYENRIGEISEIYTIITRPPLEPGRYEGCHMVAADAKHLIHLALKILRDDSFVYVSDLRLAKKVTEEPFSDYASFVLTSENGVRFRVYNTYRDQPGKKTRQMVIHGSEGRSMHIDMMDNRRVLVDSNGFSNNLIPDTPIKPAGYMTLPVLHRELVIDAISKMMHGVSVYASQEDRDLTLKTISLAQVLDNMAVKEPNWYVRKAKLEYLGFL